MILNREINHVKCKLNNDNNFTLISLIFKFSNHYFFFL